MIELSDNHEMRSRQFAGLQGIFVSAYAALEKTCVVLQENYRMLEDQYAEQKIALIDYKQKAHYWEAQFQQNKSKEQNFLSEIEALKAQLRKREQQLFGNKSERNVKSESLKQKSTRSRGQQPDTKGPLRRAYPNLPQVEEIIQLPDMCCPCCRKPYAELSDTEDSEVLEVINVKAYCRNIKRKRYRSACDCPENPYPPLISAPVVDKLFPKCKFGVSIWAYLLIQKFAYHQPLFRSLQQLAGNGLSLAMGTVTEGFQKALPLLAPVYDAIVEKSISADHWHRMKQAGKYLKR